MSRSRLMLVLLVFAAALLVLWMIPRFGSDPPDKVPGADNLVAYSWFPDGDVFGVRAGPTGIDIIRLDGSTGNRKPIAALNRRIRSVIQGGTSDLRLSPNGAILRTAVTRTVKPEFVFSSLDGKREIRMKGSATDFFRPEMAWLSDNRRWIEWVSTPKGRRAFLRDIEAPDSQPIPIPLPRGVRSILTMTPNNRMILTDFTERTSHDRGVNLYELPVNSPMSKPTHTHLSGPSSSDVDEIKLSPDRKWMAWGTRIFVKQPAPLLEKALQFLRPQSSHRHLSSEIWVSRSDGTHLSQLKQFSRDEVLEGIFSIDWTPDSRRISYLQDRTLYTIPAVSR